MAERTSGGTIAYRCVVLAALLGGFGTIGNALWTSGVKDHDANISNTQLLLSQGEKLTNISGKLDQAFGRIESNNGIVVEKLNALRTDLDVLKSRVGAIENRRNSGSSEPPGRSP